MSESTAVEGAEPSSPLERSTFPLTSLPIELHLRVLHYCIMAPIPIVNSCIPRANQHGIAISEAAGQELINPGIIFTCKLYAAEGLAIAYASNTFLFTNISSSKYFKPSSRDFYSKIQNLIVRHDILEGRVYRKCNVGTVDWLRHFWSPRVLQIDFRAGVWEHYHYMFDELEHDFEQAVSQGISLSRLTVTGLACNTPAKFLTQMAPLLQPGGRVSISFEPD